MPQDLAIEAHPPQYEERADDPVRQRQRETGNQRRTHEGEGDERLDDQRLRRHHTAVAGNAASVLSQARQRRARTSVHGKCARTTSRSWSTAITVLPARCHCVTWSSSTDTVGASTAANGSSSRIIEESCRIRRANSARCSSPTESSPTTRLSR